MNPYELLTLALVLVALVAEYRGNYYATELMVAAGLAVIAPTPEKALAGVIMVAAFIAINKYTYYSAVPMYDTEYDYEYDEDEDDEEEDKDDKK